MGVRRLVAALVVAAAFLGIVAAASAAGPPGNSYLCYSKLQVDPGVWSDAPGNVGGDTSSEQLMALGYWKPFAEKTTPTATLLPGGWYLDCNPAEATTQSGGTMSIVGGSGELVTDATLASDPGYYPALP
jgi:hypothetical protein